ncbi:hypothetical protein T492DRAFT_841203 [Pavlovales sp. CCMP2436]|nr:hypothetical protein T492DRAFT_841203 [Pavlovales sp. CCMP2436]
MAPKNNAKRAEELLAVAWPSNHELLLARVAKADEVALNAFGLILERARQLLRFRTDRALFSACVRAVASAVRMRRDCEFLSTLWVQLAYGIVPALWVDDDQASASDQELNALYAECAWPIVLLLVDSKPAQLIGAKNQVKLAPPKEPLSSRVEAQCAAFASSNSHSCLQPMTRRLRCRRGRKLGVRPPCTREATCFLELLPALVREVGRLTDSRLNDREEDAKLTDLTGSEQPAHAALTLLFRCACALTDEPSASKHRERANLKTRRALWGAHPFAPILSLLAAVTAAATAISPGLLKMVQITAHKLLQDEEAICAACRDEPQTLLQLRALVLSERAIGSGSSSGKTPLDASLSTMAIASSASKSSKGINKSKSSSKATLIRVPLKHTALSPSSFSLLGAGRSFASGNLYGDRNLGLTLSFPCKIATALSEEESRLLGPGQSRDRRALDDRDRRKTRPGPQYGAVDPAHPRERLVQL